MTRLNIVLVSLLAIPTALATPKVAKRFGTGTGLPYPVGPTCGPYGCGNGTAGPTATGTAPTILSTVVVNPFPASSSYVPSSAVAPLSMEPSACGPVTVTVTASAVTVTVSADTDAPLPATSTPVEPSYPSSAYPSWSANITAVGPTGTGTGAPTWYPTGTAAPQQYAVVRHGYKHFSLHHKLSSVHVPSSSSVVYPSSSSSAAPIAVSSSTSSSSSSVYTPPAYTPPSSSAASSSVVAAPVPSSSSVPVYKAPSTTAVVSSSIAAPVAVISSTPSAAAAPVAVSETTTTGSITGRGIAYVSGDQTQPFVGSKAPWAYNWDSKPISWNSDGSPLAPGFKYVPMLWKPDSNHLPQWDGDVKNAIALGADHILSFNEPDNGGQANLDPVTAANDHIKYLNPYSNNGAVKIGSPAVTQGGSPDGITWLTSFQSACQGKCTVDFWVFHWYGPTGMSVANQISYFQKYVGQAITFAAGKPVWFTEIQADPTSSAQDQNDFMQQMITWLDTQSAVERYAWNLAAKGFLTTGSGLSSPLGTTYASYAG